MARLELEFSAKGIESSTSGIRSLSSALTTLEKKYEEAQFEVKELARESKKLESNLHSLNQQFRAGSISEERFAKESSDLANEIADVRQQLGLAQRNVVSIKSSMDQATNSTRSFGTATKNLQAYSNDFTSGIRSAYGVSIEFTRILQDMPYGMQGIANNLQQLFTNWGYYSRSVKEAAAAQGQVVTTGGLMRGVLSSMLSPANLLTLGVSLLTAGWVWYEKSQQKANKALKDGKKEIKDYTENLNNLSRALYSASQSYASDIAKLNTLIAVTRDASASVKARESALGELQKMYPKVFKNFDTETIKTQAATLAYRELTASIIANATARAAEGRIAEKSGNQLSLDEQNKDIREQISLLDQQIKRQEELTGLPGQAVGGVAESIESGNVRRLNALYDQRNKLQEQATANLLERAKLQEDINDLSELAVKNQLKVNRDLIDTTKESTRSIRDYGEAISNVFSEDISPADIVGLSGIDAATEKTRQKYEKLYRQVDKLEAEALKKYADNQDKRTEAVQRASDERAEIAAAEAKENERNEAEYAQATADIIDGILSKAGLSRIRSREQELAQSSRYYDELEKQHRDNADILNAITEARKASEAQINDKWDAKINETQFVYQRRLNESMTQMLMSRLNRETKEKVEAAKSDAEKLKQIQEDYWRQIDAIEKRDRETKVQLAFDGDALSVPLANVRAQMEELKRSFEQGTLSVAAFQQKISDLELQRQQLQLFQGTVDNISDAFGNLYADAIFDTENAIENLGKAFEQTAKSIISGLIKIGIRYLINQAIGTSSMAATAAASSATAATVAASWATAAALVSAATFGANAAAGGGALAALIASTKALSGFSKGGYTGNYRRNEIAGFVHGQEFVINAQATRENLPLLRAINAGVDVSSLMAHSAGIRDYGSISKNSNHSIEVWVDGEIQNGVIKLSNDAGNRKHKRFFR